MAHLTVPHAVVPLSSVILVEDVEFPVSNIRSSLHFESLSIPTTPVRSASTTHNSDTDNSDGDENVLVPTASTTSLKRKRSLERPRVFETNHLRLRIKRIVEIASQSSKRLKIRIPAQKAVKQPDNHLGASSRVNVDATPLIMTSPSVSPQELKKPPQNPKITTKAPKSRRSFPLAVDPHTCSSSASQKLPETTRFKIKIPPLSRLSHSDKNAHQVAITPNTTYSIRRRIAPLPKRFRE